MPLKGNVISHLFNKRRLNKISLRRNSSRNSPRVDKKKCVTRKNVREKRQLAVHNNEHFSNSTAEMWR